MVTQDGHLFHESIRENLLFAAPEASEDELWAALRDARLEPSYGRCRRASTRSSASAATGCPAANVSV